jgi:UDP-glucose 6-dehydrogenase
MFNLDARKHPPAIFGMGALGTAFQKATTFRVGKPMLEVDLDPQKGMSPAEFMANYGNGCPVVFVCVPAPKGTPNNHPGSFYDRSALREVITTLGNGGFSGELVILTSISPWDVLDLAAAANRFNFNFHTFPVFHYGDDLCMDILQPHEVVIGIDSRVAKERMSAAAGGDYEELVTPALALLKFLYPDYRVVVTDAATAAMLKLMTDAWWKHKRSYIVAMLKLWETFCADDAEHGVRALHAAFALHPEIGRKFIEDLTLPIPKELLVSAEAVAHLLTTLKVNT